MNRQMPGQSIGKEPQLIRPAEIADVDAIHACVTEAYQPYIQRIGKPPGPMLENYRDVVQQHSAFVIDVQGQIAGILVLIHQTDSILLDNVAVHPANQGMGIGRDLMDFAEAEARRQGFQAIDLYTHECMTENIKLYKRLGYVETERRTEKGYARVYMRKHL